MESTRSTNSRPSLGFVQALGKVPLVISFASFPDETALQADYVFPDHTGLEAWGYQKILTGADRPVISGLQPVVAPFYDTRATADVFLAAVQAIGGQLATAVPYKDEVEYLQHSLGSLMSETGLFQRTGYCIFLGIVAAKWRLVERSRRVGQPGCAKCPGEQPWPSPHLIFDGQGDFYLFPFFSTLLSDGSGANKPWLQETPDPTTTVVWNSWVEINPATADKLGLADDDVVKVYRSFWGTGGICLPLSGHPSRHDCHPIWTRAYGFRAVRSKPGCQPGQAARYTP